MALVGILLSIFDLNKWPSVLAVLAVIAIAAGLGRIHWLLITRLKIQPFIVTLCGCSLSRTGAVIANDATKGSAKRVHGCEPASDSYFVSPPRFCF